MNTKHLVAALVLLGLFCVQARAEDEALLDDHLSAIRDIVKDLDLSDAAVKGLFKLLHPLHDAKCKDCWLAVQAGEVVIGAEYHDKCKDCVEFYTEEAG